MKLKDLLKYEITTTQEPVRSGRNPAVWPVLIVPHPDLPNDTIYQVADRYSQSYVERPKDNTGKPMAGVYDIYQEGDDKRVARYRWHPDHGWCIEVQTTWTVSSDYPSVKAALHLLTCETEAPINVSVAMRLGVGLAAILTGADDDLLTKTVSDLLAELNIGDFLTGQKNA